ncbi:MAG: DUF2318 domain-containing protein [Clostridiales bacterium]|mgnify:CR=1 FL=1|nr:DUF2318 domain-containing protein [Clostridiales bacterium]
MGKNTYKKRNRKKSIITASVSIAVVLLFIYIIVSDSPSDIRAKKVIDDDIVIQASEIDETARFYSTKIDGNEIEVLAVRSSDGTIRTAFNTCQSCYSSGRGFFVQEDNVLICNNCGNQFTLDQIEKSNGACNPVPITESMKIVTENTITIPQEYLSQAVVMFQSWK